MGLFDASSAARSRSRSRYGGSTIYRTQSPARSTYSSKSAGAGNFYSRPSNARSSSSFFGGASRSYSQSRSPWFGSSRSSYYGRRPRDGYVQYLMHKLQRMIKELWYYMRKNPMKAFFAVIVPLLSAGGAIHGLLKNFGVRLPFFDMGGSGSSSRGRGYSSKSTYSKHTSGNAGWGSTMSSLMQVARAFA